MAGTVDGGDRLEPSCRERLSGAGRWIVFALVGSHDLLGAEQVTGGDARLGKEHVQGEAKNEGNGEEHRMLQHIDMLHDPQFLHVLSHVRFVAKEHFGVVGPYRLLQGIGVGIVAAVGIAEVFLLHRAAEEVDLAKYIGPFKERANSGINPFHRLRDQDHIKTIMPVGRGPRGKSVVFGSLPFARGKDLLHLIEHDQSSRLHMHPEIRNLPVLQKMQLLHHGQIGKAAITLDHLQADRIRDAVNVGINDPAPLQVIGDLLHRFIGLARAGSTGKTDDHGYTLVKTEGIRFKVKRIR